MTTGKTIALTRQTFVGKVMSLLFNMLSRLVIAFLPRSKCLLISWLQSPSEVILEPPKITVSIVSCHNCHCFYCFPICQEVMGPDAMILFSECWVLSQLFHSLLSLSSRGFLVPPSSLEIDGEKMERSTGFIFLGSKITSDDDFCHEIKICLLFGRKAMTNLDSIL